MKVGDLVKVVQPAGYYENQPGPDSGKLAMIINRWHHPPAGISKLKWFDILVCGEMRQYREDYLEAQ